jgi:hypothetical protein
MSDTIVLPILKEIIGESDDILKNRYAGDAEFQNFKNYVAYRRNLIMLFIFLLFLLTAGYLIDNIKINVEISNIPVIISGLISITLLWRFLVNHCATREYIKYVPCGDENSINIKWNVWQFKDLIFQSPWEINANTKLTKPNYDSGKHVLYYLCQYPNGHLRWLGLDNIKIKINNQHERTVLYENFDFEKSVSEFMKLEFVDCAKDSEGKLHTIERYELIPDKILGVRIRCRDTHEVTIANIGHN